MASKNVEIADRLGDVWTSADWAQAEPLFWPDAEAQAPEGWPEAEDSEGWPAIQQQFERLKETWLIYRFRDGKVSRMEFYLDREQAMSARGL
jgi:hypothetical protein